MVKTYLFVITASIIVALIGISVLIWIVAFIDELDINWTKPIDIICDSAEKAARFIKEMKGNDKY